MFRNAKYRAIIEDPVIRYKPVESLPGVGPVHGRRLRDHGFYTADQVLAQYLALKRNEQRFVSWMIMASGVSAHWAAQCFNGLNEWYNTWGQDLKISKKTPPSPNNERGSITNRMLLEQKMLQFNSNSNEDRLRSLFSNQTISLVDISKSTERPSLTLERLNKSNFNIAENTPFYLDQNRSRNFKKLTSPSPTSKSVNFNENVEFNAEMPKKAPLPQNASISKRPISPILKSRSLTPELGRISKKTLYIPNKTINKRYDVKIKGASMNNLNLNGSRTNKRETIKAKSIENISGGSNTFTRNKSKTSISKKINLEKPELLVCTCDYPYREVGLLWTSSELDSINATQNIKEYFVEKQHFFEDVQNFSTNLQSSSLESNESENKSQCKEEKEEILSKQLSHKNNWDEKSTQTSNKKHSNEENIGEKQKIIINPNKDDKSDLNSDYILNGNERTSANNKETVTNGTRDLGNVEIDLKGSHEKNTSNTFQTETFVVEKNKNVSTEKMTAKNNFDNSNESNYFDNSNEDSGLDVTPKSNADYQEYTTETQTTDDEGSTTLFENGDSRSETDTDTDRTFEVNDTTDAESGFHFVSTNTGCQMEKLEDTDLIATKEILGNQNDQTNQSQFEDELKRSNIRLFCDMLSNDLEQLPMEKFRKLKLKILELVYAEIDDCEEK